MFQCLIDHMIKCHLAQENNKENILLLINSELTTPICMKSSRMVKMET